MCYMCVHVCAHVCAYVCAHVCAHVCVCMCVVKCVHVPTNYIFIILTRIGVNYIAIVFNYVHFPVIAMYYYLSGSKLYVFAILNTSKFMIAKLEVHLLLIQNK